MILVTGGTGIVGARLLFDLTSSGKKVRALKRASSKDDILDMAFAENLSLKNQIEWIQGTVTDVYDVMEAMKGVDEVYHCAAKVSFHGSEQKEIMKVNVEGTANMVNVALELGVKKFCHVSSIAALGRVEENKMMDENVFWKPSKYNSVYAISKYSSEREVWRAMEEGLKAVIVSPSIIIGPGNWKTGSSAMFRQVWKGMKYYSLGVNGFVDVRDVTASMTGLMEKNIFGERFIVSSENCSYRDIFNYIADSFQKPRPSIKVNGTLSELGWRAEKLRSFFLNKQPFITKETARNSQRKWYYSSEKIKKELGIQFIPISKSIADCAKIFVRDFSTTSR
ncbi:MAG: NAD-dependent epimerase/dehydratase family protein [Bacteroidota bacterium]